MAKLCFEEQQRYALAMKGQMFYAYCDRRVGQGICGKLIKVGELYANVQKKLKSGKLANRIHCMACDEDLHPERQKWREKRELKQSPIERKVSRIVLKLLAKKELKLGTKALHQKLIRKEIFNKLKYREFSKILKALRKAKQLSYKDKIWTLRK